MPLRSARARWFALAALVILFAAAFGLLSRARTPRLTPVARGERVAEALGCFACHGPGGTGGIANPRSRDREIPAWDGGTAMMYVERPEEIREWILFGAPRRLRAARAEQLEAGIAQPAGLVAMPAYEGRLSDQDLEDLIAYFKVIAAYGRRPSDPLAVEGRRVASRLGCFGCHGPGGRVPMPNPGSLKGVIPGWEGEDFAELVRDDEELRQWILDGGIPRLEQHPIARRFVDRQIVAMPAYRDVLADGELEAIVAYIHWLRVERTEPP